MKQVPVPRMPWRVATCLRSVFIFRLFCNLSCRNSRIGKSLASWKKSNFYYTSTGMLSKLCYNAWQYIYIWKLEWYLLPCQSNQVKMELYLQSPDQICWGPCKSRFGLWGSCHGSFVTKLTISGNQGCLGHLGAMRIMQADWRQIIFRTEQFGGMLLLRSSLYFQDGFKCLWKGNFWWLGWTLRKQTLGPWSG